MSDEEAIIKLEILIDFFKMFNKVFEDKENNAPVV